MESKDELKESEVKPKEHALGSEVELTGLIGKKVSALRIPASSLDPVTKTKFDGDDLLLHEYKP